MNSLKFIIINIRYKSLRLELILYIFIYFTLIVISNIIVSSFVDDSDIYSENTSTNVDSN